MPGPYHLCRIGGAKMRSLIVTGLLVLAGCQGVVGPIQRSQAPCLPRVDDPRLPIAEQERRGRDRYALPEDSPSVAPPIK
jgi:hypothetical protein